MHKYQAMKSQCKIEFRDVEIFKKGAVILLSKKIDNDINRVNSVMEVEEMPSSDQGKDIMRSLIRGCTSFENSFDDIIKAGKAEGKEI